MECVVVEVSYDQPLSEAALPEQVQAASWCFQLHQVAHRRAHLALDGRKSACVFRAPDAESLRIAMRQLGVADSLVWSAQVFDPPGVDTSADSLRDGAAIAIVERSFAQPVPVAEIQAIEDRGAWCLEQHNVRFLRTYASLDQLRMLCLYDAPDAESVRLAQEKAGVPFDRVWAARLLLEPDEAPRAR